MRWATLFGSASIAFIAAVVGIVWILDGFAGLSTHGVIALVAGTGSERIPETLFFARRLRDAGHRLAGIVVNQVHPPLAVPRAVPPALAPGLGLVAWLGERDARGVRELSDLLAGDPPLVAVPLRPVPPTTVAALSALGRELARSPLGR